jgi:branched-chain amino acid transport system substrate-binding protein
LVRAEFDSFANKRFVAAMEMDHGVLPGGFSAGMYIAGQCTKQPFSPRWQGRGPQSARRRFASGFLTDTPRGPVKFDHFGDVVGDVFVRKRDRKNGQLAKAVINYSNMSQFWTYDEKPFLTSPIRP